MWLVDALQTAVRSLQCRQRGLDVAGQLQLLAGNQENLFDFGQYRFVAVARHFLVHLLQRDLMALGFGQFLFQQIELGLSFARGFLSLAGENLAFLVACFESAETAAQGEFQIGIALARVEPLPAEQQQGQQRQDQRDIQPIQPGFPGCARRRVVHGFLWCICHSIKPINKPSSPAVVVSTCSSPKLRAAAAILACGTNSGVFFSHCWPSFAQQIK